MTQRLLSIESATEWLSIALLDGEDVILLRESEGTRQHASALLPLIDEGLREAGWSLGELDALVVSAGPGSFTSLRIGLATAKGLAFGRELEGIAVSTLEAMALAVLEGESRTPDAPVVTLLDARRGEWYAGGWSPAESATGPPTPILTEGLYSPEHLVGDLGRAVVVSSPERAGWRAEFEDAGLAILGSVEGKAARPTADWVGRLGARRLGMGEGGPAGELSARYLRRAEAEAKRLGGPVERGELARVEESGA